MINIESESKRAIEAGGLDHVLKEIILRIEAMESDFYLLKTRRSERAGKRLSSKFMKLECVLREYRQVMLALRRHNLIAKKIERDDGDFKL